MNFEVGQVYLVKCEVLQKSEVIIITKIVNMHMNEKKDTRIYVKYCDPVAEAERKRIDGGGIDNYYMELDKALSGEYSLELIDTELARILFKHEI